MRQHLEAKPLSGTRKSLHPRHQPNHHLAAIDLLGETIPTRKTRQTDVVRLAPISAERRATYAPFQAGFHRQPQ
jgi:hypothetical protein